MLGALLVRGTIIAIMLTVTVTLNQVLYYKSAARTVQTELSSLVEVMESDFRRVGYNVTASSSFFLAETSQVAFYADIDNDGNPDTIEYLIGSTGELADTPNPDDRLLYRLVNGDTLTVGAGMTRFYLKYYALGGAPLILPVDVSLIGSLDITLHAEHGYFTFPDSLYPAAHWERRLFPTNL